eukprot:109831-Pyramimonas_sp.AAC.1
MCYSSTFLSGFVGRSCFGATVRIICGVGIQIIMFWHASGSSNSCLLTRQFPQWKQTVVEAYEEGAWREGLFQHR